ncbi:MAG: MBL fold metallo-hydrolase [Spirochaetota bacterium]|jgi:phosphoribosyl 1,2-cyclic phosphodiesterase|nr:MBL fold metallo-hydrolase [Spirochaetota bacterium]
MYLQFYGVRGSIPTPPLNEEYEKKIREILARAAAEKSDLSTMEARENFIHSLPFALRSSYGGNTSCVYLNIEGVHVIFDMGSGLRHLGRDLIMKDFGYDSNELYIFLSHTHWDHIQGLPFFIPAYLDGNTIHIYSPTEHLAARLKRQQNAPYFPITLTEMGAKFLFHKFQLNKISHIRNFRVRALELKHPGRSFAYRIEYGEKSLVYATDTEFNNQSPDFIRTCIDFFHAADVLICDAQYTAKETFEKLNWGHSSANSAIDIAIKSRIKRLVFFHHEPGYNDAHLADIHDDAIRYYDLVKGNHSMELIPAYEGLEINF